ncbi:hypothetical protein NDU88_006313 [Pleurodeles waltl]|uniref:Uncharacterized protein n=1 Tax=Pleurodeles waltl TaxID=8319 RepID=A0AAV7UM31_PLEWA|nr:hypothetical protein NDU88_006313 [Pleurodeles waltl]
MGVASLSDHAPLMLTFASPSHASVTKCWRLIYEDILIEIEGSIRHYLEANDTPGVGQLHALDDDRAEYADRDTTLGEIARGGYWLIGSGCRRRDGMWRSNNCRMAHGLNGRTALSLSLSNSILICMRRKGLMGGVEAHLASVPLPRLPLTNGEALDGDITVAEVLPAIQRLLAGKVPEADGFSAEFYKSFGPVLAPVLAQLCNLLDPAVPLPPAMQLGIVTAC